MEKDDRSPRLSHLDRREAQAPLVASLIRAFVEAFGEEEALAVVREVIRKDAVCSGRALAEAMGGDGPGDLLNAVNQVWAEDGTLEIANVEVDDRGLAFDVTKCGYAEMYRRLGLEDLGTLMSCDRDFSFQDGFNPAIRLTRTTTIMEGADCCDFRYRVEDED